RLSGERCKESLIDTHVLSSASNTRTHVQPFDTTYRGQASSIGVKMMHRRNCNNLPSSSNINAPLSQNFPVFMSFSLNRTQKAKKGGDVQPEQTANLSS